MLQGHTLCLLHVPECLRDSCSEKHWWDGGCLHRQHHARRAGAGPVSATKKKTQIIIIFFFTPFEILSCGFAEVGALAAMASAKCRYTLGVLCSAHTSRSLCVGEIPVDSNMGMLPCSTSGRPQRRILGFKRQVSQKHVSLLTHLLNYFSCYLALQSASFGKAALANWAVCGAGYGQTQTVLYKAVPGWIFPQLARGGTSPATGSPKAAPA